MTHFDSLLIANRGEIVTRVARTARAMGLKTIAVASDADHAAPHTQACDTVMPIGGERPADSYLRIDKLLAAARTSGAQAVHPGYGFLSENAAFAQAVIDAGLVWVGPAPTAMWAMADKSRARQRMAAAGFAPCRRPPPRASRATSRPSWGWRWPSPAPRRAAAAVPRAVPRARPAPTDRPDGPVAPRVHPVVSRDQGDESARVAAPVPAPTHARLSHQSQPQSPTTRVARPAR